MELARQETGINYLQTVITYLMKTTERDRISRQDYRALLEGVPGAEGVMPTVADEWIEQGKQQGLQQGLERGLEQGIERGLERGLEQGLEQGLERGRQQAVVQVLTARFGSVPPDLVDAMSRIQDGPGLVQLLQAAATTKSLADFVQSLSH